MSKLFFDYLIILDDLELEIKEIAESEEERHELWQIVDETINNRVLEVLLDRLAEEHHDEFLNRFHEAPYDERLIIFLNHRIEGNIENIIKEEVESLAIEILREIKRE
ncbi:hypothetical protein IID22_03420 [Patescibacteria group bacterium]|nr:hypothetical protein [Patescibacteria group bacterium]